MRIMDLKYVRSELRKLSEIVEGWNANQEIGSLERDLVLDKLRTLYEAVRFDAEAEPPAADASEQEPFPTEIPVSLDLGEVLSIEPLPVAEPELPSLSGSGPEPESGFIAPLAESGADFPDCDTAAAETVAESVLDSVPADGQEPAGVVAEPAEIPAEPAAGRIAEAEPPVAGLVSDPETPAAEEIPAPESTGNSAGKEVPAENIAAASESHGDSGSQEFARVPGASGPQGVTDPRDEPAHREAPSGMPEPEAIAGSGAETGVTLLAPGAGAHPAAAQQPIAPTLFGIEEETQRHRHKQRVIMSLYNPEPTAARPTAEKPAPSPAAGDAAKPVAGRPQLPTDSPATDSPATDSPEPASGPGASAPGAPRMFAGDEAPAEGAYAASVPQRPVPVSDTGDDDEEPDFEEITLAGNGVPNNGAVLGEVINHDKQTLADTIVPPRDMASELRRSEPVTDLRRAIGINDKFLMIRDLFDGDARAYEAALDKLDAFSDFDDCMIYIAENYAWNANSDGAKFLMELLERKFA